MWNSMNCIYEHNKFIMYFLGDLWDALCCLFLLQIFFFLLLKYPNELGR